MFSYAFNNRGLIKIQIYIKYINLFNTSIEKGNPVVKRGGFCLRHVSLKSILKLSLYIHKVTVLIHSSTMKPAYKDLSVKDHIKQKMKQ